MKPSKPATTTKAPAAAEPPPKSDPEATLASIKATIARLDSVMERASDAIDAAGVRMAISMGASEADVNSLLERQAEAKARKEAAQQVGAPGAAAYVPESSAPPVPKKKKGWKAPQDPATRAKALGQGAPPPPAYLERCWNCFEDLPPAGSWDWLGKGCCGEKDRPGQPLKRFLQPGPHRNFPSAPLLPRRCLRRLELPRLRLPVAAFLSSAAPCLLSPLVLAPTCGLCRAQPACAARSTCCPWAT